MMAGRGTTAVQRRLSTSEARALTYGERRRQAWSGPERKRAGEGAPSLERGEGQNGQDMEKRAGEGQSHCRDLRKAGHVLGKEGLVWINKGEQHLHAGECRGRGSSNLQKWIVYPSIITLCGVS